MRIKNEKGWLDMARTIYAKQTTTVTYKAKPVDDGLLTIPLDKLFELYGNLILNGFSADEAIEITAKVAANAVRTN